MMTAPIAVLLRPVVVGVFAIAAASAGVFGWMLPYFA